MAKKKRTSPPSPPPIEAPSKAALSQAGRASRVATIVAHGVAARDPESLRLDEDALREKNWKRWGPYLSERQWGTVREDYSAGGDCWNYLPHDHARSRAYRWGEDGLLGITDRECRLCFAIALWNGRDPILKERLFGLTGSEGNHGEDVKEAYFYLDSTPTHSYMKALYKYPQSEFPYDRLVAENRRRGKHDPEFELADTGVFDHSRYFDIFAEYAKAAPDDILIRITIANRGPDPAPLHLLPTLWFRNTWSWGRTGEGYWPKPSIALGRDGRLVASHATLQPMHLSAAPGPDGTPPEWLFTENETNAARLFGSANASPYVKDAFHDHVVGGRRDAVNPARTGTKAAAYYKMMVPAGGTSVVTLRLSAGTDAVSAAASAAAVSPASGPHFDREFARAIAEADQYHANRTPESIGAETRSVIRQSDAGLLWSKQFYHYVVHDWLAGDPAQPTPPPQRLEGRNADWPHLFNRDVISMPDKWEYPWYAAWDLAFHTLPLARLDPFFAKEQLVLMLREWYMHPNGQIPAYEFAFGDVNPPVHAWACWRVYKMSAPRGGRDRVFLSRVFQKLLINFTWWVNRKDAEGKHLFSGGFLGLDNIGVFDRSKPLPTGGHLEQADGTAWMAFYAATMLSISLELSRDNPATEDVASKFFEHFIAIADAMNNLGGFGLWDEEDGFYYDQLHVDGHGMPLRVRSLVGLIPLIAVEVLEQDTIDRLPGFRKRLDWFLKNRADLAKHISYFMEDAEHEEGGRGHGGERDGGDARGHGGERDGARARSDDHSGARRHRGQGGERAGAHGDRRDGDAPRSGHRLLAIPSRDRLVRVLRYMLDENEFLGPYGIRSVSKVHEKQPYVFPFANGEYTVRYTPGESDTGLFGGNSNWRGPIWMPINYLLVEALERYHHFYGDSLKVECPTGSGRMLNLLEVAREIGRRLGRLFLPDAAGRRPCHGDDERFARDPHWKDLALFHEYFHGDTGRGLGASHQTGWTALAARYLLGA